MPYLNRGVGRGPKSYIPDIPEGFNSCPNCGRTRPKNHPIFIGKKGKPTRVCYDCSQKRVERMVRNDDSTLPERL